VTAHIAGVLSPVVTPFSADLSPDRDRFVRHCKWLLAHGCAGLAVFGTNSEANSLSVEERMQLLEALVAAGVPPDRLMPGTGCSALPDSVRLTEHAVKLGCAGVLMLPPFYYKGVSDDGLFRSYAEIIQRVGDTRLRVYLYHIPQVSGVPISIDLIARLLEAFPAYDCRHQGFLERLEQHPASCSMRFSGRFRRIRRQRDISSAEPAGRRRRMHHRGRQREPARHRCRLPNWQTTEAEQLQSGANAIRAALQSVPMIPALKAAIACYAQDPCWETVRPPLTRLSSSQHDEPAGAASCPPIRDA
jgi:4-hydroxy-tetrahydrodipicolinate synthase